MTARRVLRTLEDLAGSDAWVEATLVADGRLGATDRLRVRLAVHELVVNVIEHAYAAVDGRVEIAFEPHPDGLEFLVIDEGGPFSGPRRRRLPEEPSQGGYGLPIIDAVFDHVSHSRNDGLNTWRLSIAAETGEELQP